MKKESKEKLDIYWRPGGILSSLCGCLQNRQLLSWSAPVLPRAERYIAPVTPLLAGPATSTAAGPGYLSPQNAFWSLTTVHREDA